MCGSLTAAQRDCKTRAVWCECVHGLSLCNSFIGGFAQKLYSLSLVRLAFEDLCIYCRAASEWHHPSLNYFHYIAAMRFVTAVAAAA